VPSTDSKTETLKQIASILHNKTIDAEPNNMTETTTDTPTLLRVPPADAPMEATPTDTTYQQKSQYKKRTNKHKQQKGKFVASDDDTTHAANHTMELLKSSETQTHYCFSAIHPDTGLPAEY